MLNPDLEFWALLIINGDRVGNFGRFGSFYGCKNGHFGDQRKPFLWYCQLRSSPEPAEWEFFPQMLPPSQTWSSKPRMVCFLPSPRALNNIFCVPLPSIHVGHSPSRCGSRHRLQATFGLQSTFLLSRAVLQSTPHPGRTYSRVRHTRVGCNLEYVTPGLQSTFCLCRGGLQSTSYLEYVVTATQAHTIISHGTNMGTYLKQGRFHPVSDSPLYFRKMFGLFYPFSRTIS